MENEANDWGPEAWCAALAEHFFGERFEQLPVLFFVDGDILAALHPSGDPAQAACSLSGAVRAQLCRPEPRGVFDAIERHGRTWKVRGGDGVPPFLHLLALCVLAASRMGTGPVAPNNYRYHISTLLGLADSRMPAGFRDSLYIMWEWLRWWLDDSRQGALGLSTIVPAPPLTHISLPISQTLFRTADAARLDGFFRWIGLEPGEEIDGEMLLAYFRAWSPARGLSDGAIRMLNDEPFGPTIQRILTAYASNWDGTRSDRTGPRSVALRIVVTAFTSIKARAQALQPEGYPDRLAGRLAGAAVFAQADGGVYDLTVDVDGRLLSEGIRLSAAGCSLALEGSAVHVLRLDEDLGGWSSVDALTPGERHWLLVSSSQAEDVLAQLDRRAGEEYTFEPGPSPLKDWTLVRNVVVDDPSGLSGALGERRPTERHRLALRGGLPLLARHAYLPGGAPDLWLPAAPSPASPVRINETRISSGSEVVALSEHIDPAEAAEHQVEYERVQRTFFTIASTVRQPSAEGVPAHVFTLSDAGEVIAYHESETQAGDARVIGPVVESPKLAPRPAPVLLRRGAQAAWLLGSRPGEVVACRPPTTPGWLTRVGLSDHLYEARAEFPVAWVVGRWQLEPLLRIRPAGHEPVAVEPSGSAADRQLWAQLLADATLETTEQSEVALLEDYRAAALGGADHGNAA